MPVAMAMVVTVAMSMLVVIMMVMTTMCGLVLVVHPSAADSVAQKGCRMLGLVWLIWRLVESRLILAVVGPARARVLEHLKVEKNFLMG